MVSKQSMHLILCTWNVNGDSQRVIKAFKDMPALGEGSGGWESVFGLDREHNFVQSTWYFRTDLATRLYKRLLGYEIDGIGGDTVSPVSSLVFLLHY